jgi:hypothetical protein
LVALAPFIFLEIVDESANDGTCSGGLVVDIFEFVGSFVLFIQDDIEFAPDFGATPLRVSRESNEPCICLGIKTFGNIMATMTPATTRMARVAKVR